MVSFTLDEHSDTDSSRYDIEESFEALDIQKTGRLEVELAYSLLLGLGYLPDHTKKDIFNPRALEEAAKRIESVENKDGKALSSGITLETLLKVVDTHPALSQVNRAESFATRCYKLMDRDQKGYIAASDVESMGREIGMIDPKWNHTNNNNNQQQHEQHEQQQQSEMNISMEEANEMIETTNKMFAAKNNRKTEKQHRLQASVFAKIFEPSFH